MFSCEFCEIYKNTFFAEHLWTAASSSTFMEVMKKVETGFSSLYQIGFSKIYSAEKVRSLGMGEGIPLKRTKKDGREEDLMVRIIAKEKSSKKFFLIV